MLEGQSSRLPGQVLAGGGMKAREKQTQGGFTLIEFTVVLFILALLAAVTMPKFLSFFSRGDLDLFASRLATFIEHLRDEAVYKKKGFYLTYEPSKNRFWVTDAAGEANREVLMRPLNLPEGVVVSDIVVGEGEKRFDGEIQIPFSPGGKAQAALIHLRGRDEKQVTLEIPSLARKVKRHEGYLEKS